MMVRVVARAHRVDVVALEERNIPQHVVKRDRAAVLGVCLVTVHPLELNLPSVHENRIAGDLHLLEAYLPRANIRSLLHNERVEVRLLGAPEVDIMHLDRALRTRGDLAPLRIVKRPCGTRATRHL